MLVFRAAQLRAVLLRGYALTPRAASERSPGWNDEFDSPRRYVLLVVVEHDKVILVKVVTGKTVARLDSTGT